MKSQNKENLIVTVPLGDICDEDLYIIINGLSYDIVSDVMEYIFDACLDYRDKFETIPDNVFGVLIKLTNFRYEDAQIGNYPPPNVELPGYWDFDIEFLGFEYYPDKITAEDVSF